jgi:hypothetical protein
LNLAISACSSLSDNGGGTFGSTFCATAGQTLASTRATNPAFKKTFVPDIPFGMGAASVAISRMSPALSREDMADMWELLAAPKNSKGASATERSKDFC